MSLMDLTTRPHLVWGKFPYFDTDTRAPLVERSGDWGELTQQRVQRAYMSSLLSQRSAVLDSREQSLNSRSASLRAICELLEAHMASLDRRATTLVSISTSLDIHSTSVDIRTAALDEYATRLDQRARALDSTADDLKNLERKLAAEENRLTSRSTEMGKREAELLDREHRLARGENALEDKRKRFDAMRQLHRASADSTFAKAEARTRYLDAREETLSQREHIVKQKEHGKSDLGATRTGKKIPPLDTTAPPAPGLTPPATPCAITESLSSGSDGIQELASVGPATQFLDKSSTCSRAFGNSQVKDSDSPGPKRSVRKEPDDMTPSKLRAWPEVITATQKRADTRKASSVASAAMSSTTSVASSASWRTVPSTSDESATAPAQETGAEEVDTWQFTPGPPRGAVRPRPLTDQELIAYCETLGSVWTYSRNELNSTEKQAIPVLGTSWSMFIPWNKAMESRLGMAKGLASALRHRLATLRIEEHVSAPRRRRYVLPEEEARLLRVRSAAL